MGIIIAILLFSGIIIIHELGHFLLAKANKIRVDEFSLGLGPTLFGKEFHGTKFSLKLLPFGGACMMGEDDVDDLSEGSFNSKSVWARMSVIVAGPVFNLILAWILCTIVVAWVGYMPPVVDSVEPGYAAYEAGIQQGDVIKEINGKNIHLWNEISLYNMTHAQEEEAEIVYERDGKEYTVTLELRQLAEDMYKKLGVTNKMCIRDRLDCADCRAAWRRKQEDPGGRYKDVQNYRRLWSDFARRRGRNIDALQCRSSGDIPIWNSIGTHFAGKRKRYAFPGVCR